MFMIPDLSVDWEDPHDSGVSLLIDDAGGDVEVRLCFFELCCKTIQNIVNTRILLYTKY